MVADAWSMILTGGGIVILFYSLFVAHQLRKQLGEGQVKNAWDVLSVFIALFVVGYIGQLFNILYDFISLNSHLYTSIIFFLGAVFVLLTARLNKDAFSTS